MPTKQKFYVVVEGKVPGIYTSWEETRKMITGVKAAHTSFTSRIDAENFYKSSVTSMPSKIDIVADSITVYTDGSLMKGLMGYGIVVLGSHDIFHNNVNEIYGKVPTIVGRAVLNNTNIVAELYAIYKALKLVKGNLIIWCDCKSVVDSLTVYCKAWELNNWVGVRNKELIKSILALMGCRIVDIKHIYSHNGDEYNEIADKLAKRGTTSDKECIII